MPNFLRGAVRSTGLLYMIFGLALLAALQYAGADTAGSTLIWHLPNAGFLDTHLVHVRANVPAAALGTRYPVTIVLSSAQTDAAPGDNSASAAVQLARQAFAPLIEQ